MYIKKIVDNRNDDSVATSMRRKRFQLFTQLLATVPRPATILDVGGTQGFWERMSFIGIPDIKITVLNLEPQAVKYDGFVSVLGNATDLSIFADDSFDIVFSNSVIEHVGGIEEQNKMAREVGRVGKRYFVQTPNYYFPIEPHFLFPGFQWLPINLRARMLHLHDLGWYKRSPTLEHARQEVSSVSLLRKSQLQSLFPKASIYSEKVLGLTKSFVVYAGWDVSPDSLAPPIHDN